MKKSAAAGGLRMSISKEDLGGKPVEPGIYEALLRSELVESKTGKPMVKVTYTLAGTSPSGRSVAGRKVFDNIVLQIETLWKLNQPYKAVVGDDLPEGDFTIDELYGLFKEATENKRVSIDVITEPYEDRETNRVKTIL